MSLPLLSACALPRCHASPALAYRQQLRPCLSNDPSKKNIQRCHISRHRWRAWSVGRHRLGRHSARLTSNTSHPPRPDERLRLVKPSDALNEATLEKLAGFWHSDKTELASDDFAESIDDRNDDPAVMRQTASTVWSTPSARLLSALQGAGLSGLIPRRLQNKVDLSFSNVRTSEERFAAGKWSVQTKTSDAGDAKRLSDGLAAYITHVVAPRLSSTDKALLQDTLSDEALITVYNAEYSRLLHARGFEVDDVMIWSWIVTSQSADYAAKRLSAISTRLSNAGRTQVPLFVFLLILRARNLKASSLKLLMNVLWTTTSNLGLYNQPLFGQNPISEQSAVILTVRLIRHARKVWPEAFGEITSLMTQLIGAEGTLPIKPERSQRLCHIYNRILTLLSLPTSAHPFRTVAIQQQAQFSLLRKMNQFEPKLPVTREGFRALAKVQVAHKKTEMERRWARFKALGWPPWKENKSGVDSTSGTAGSLSRAVDVLARMGESGYNYMTWEKQAKVLAGWDTDRSPTIQRRKILDRPPLTRSIMSLDSGLSADPDREHEIWAARISATRTVKEAWACFCSFEKQCGSEGLDGSRQSPGRLAPWHAMFERIFYSACDVPGDHVDPGDGRETYPEPTSPHDFLYVPTEPPSVGELFRKMTTKGMRPAGRLLADLIDHAPTISRGLEYLSKGQLTEIKKDVLINAEKYHPAYIRETISSIPNFLFAAFIRLLTRARSLDLKLYRPASASSLSMRRPGSSRKKIVTSNVYATQLVAISETCYLPAWHALFAGLLRQLRNSRFKKDAQYERVQRIWISMQDLLRAMADASVTVDVACLQVIYQISEEAMMCSPHLSSTSGGVSAEQITNMAKTTVKRLFQYAVMGYDDLPTTSWLPIGSEVSLITIPSPASLPGLVRVLGIAGDFEGVLGLLRWMSRFDTELDAVSNEISNGPRMLRRTILTIRVFLERNWTEPNSEFATQAPQPLIAEAEQIVQQNRYWGGWPTDQEVQDYVKKTKGAWLHRIRELEKFRAAARTTGAKETVTKTLPPKAP